jgi:MarR family transcriptional regulator, organic hydroperoxide resistance regulator
VARSRRRARPLLLDIWVAAELVDTVLSRHLAEHDVDGYGYGTLSIIGAFGPLTPSELAARSGRPMTTMSDVVRKLVARGDVERIRNPDDGRSHLLRLTSRGDEAWRRGWPAIRQTIRAIEENTDGPIDELHDAIEDLITALRASLQTLNTKP